MTEARKRYLAYLESEHWKTLRNQVYDRAGRACECCMDPFQKLNAHHLVYRDPLEKCTEEDILCLCEDCHTVLHRAMKVKNVSVGKLDRDGTCEMIRFVWESYRLSFPKPKRKEMFKTRRMIEHKILQTGTMTRRQSETLRRLNGYHDLTRP